MLVYPLILPFIRRLISKSKRTYFLVLLRYNSLKNNNFRSKKLPHRCQHLASFYGENFFILQLRKTQILIEWLVTPYVFKYPGTIMLQPWQNGLVVKLVNYNISETFKTFYWVIIYSRIPLDWRNYDTIARRRLDSPFSSSFCGMFFNQRSSVDFMGRRNEGKANYFLLNNQ